jgi:GDP-L-fucose synthase
MEKTSRIYVAGHRGLLGSAIVKALRRRGYDNLILRAHSELDLTNQTAVQEFFFEMQPEHVFLAAARVGGIIANSSQPANFILENLLIETNVIHESYRSAVKRLLFLGSSCIYPRMAPQPIRERDWLTGPLEDTNRPYAIAKIAGVELCRGFNRQLGSHYVALMPPNLYGPNDNYDPINSHLIPALIRKIHDAKMSDAKEVLIWGTGTPRREFLYSEDAGDACVFVMNLPDDEFGKLASSDPPILNVGSGFETTILEIAELIRTVIDVKVDFKFDRTKPDGTPRKLLDSTRINALGWTPSISFEEGIRIAYQDFLFNRTSGTSQTKSARIHM